MKKNTIITSACALAMLTAYTASANVIGFNFTRNDSSVLMQGSTVDGVPLGSWTDSVDAASPAWTAALNSADTWAVTTPVNAAMVSVAWTSPGARDSQGSATDLEQGLYREFLADDGVQNGIGPEVTVSGLSAWLTSVGATGYELRFYRNSPYSYAETGGTTSPMDIYDGAGLTGTLLESVNTVTASGDGYFPSATGNNNQGTRSVQDAAGTFTADTITFTSVKQYPGRGGISGFKITAIPEPATFGMMAAFGGGLLFIRRKLSL